MTVSDSEGSLYSRRQMGSVDPVRLIMTSIADLTEMTSGSDLRAGGEGSQSVHPGRRIDLIHMTLGVDRIAGDDIGSRPVYGG